MIGSLPPTILCVPLAGECPARQITTPPRTEKHSALATLIAFPPKSPDAAVPPLITIFTAGVIAGRGIKRLGVCEAQFYRRYDPSPPSDNDLDIILTIFLRSLLPTSHRVV